MPQCSRRKYGGALGTLIPFGALAGGARYPSPTSYLGTAPLVETGKRVQSPRFAPSPGWVRLSGVFFCLRFTPQRTPRNRQPSESVDSIRLFWL